MAEPRPKSNLVNFYPQNIASGESKLSDFLVIFGNIFSQVNRSKMTYLPYLQFDTLGLRLGDCTIRDI